MMFSAKTLIPQATIDDNNQSEQNISLNRWGYLDVGMWSAGNQQIINLFCTNPHRQILWGKFHQFYKHIKTHAPDYKNIIVDGSFITRSQYPSDIDVVINVGDNRQNYANWLKYLEDNVNHFMADYWIDCYLMRDGEGHSVAEYFKNIYHHGNPTVRGAPKQKGLICYAS